MLPQPPWRIMRGWSFGWVGFSDGDDMVAGRLVVRFEEGLRLRVGAWVRDLFTVIED
jgi:hypothetical protein